MDEGEFKIAQINHGYIPMDAKIRKQRKHQAIEALAFEYSQLARYRDQTNDERWLNAERDLGWGTYNFTPFAQVLAEKIEPAESLVRYILTFSTGLTALFTAVGGLFLYSYLRGQGASFPSADASASLLAITIVFVSAISISLLVALFTFPFLLKYTEPDFHHLYTSLFFSQRLIVLHDRARQYAIEYGKFFSAYLFIMLGLFGFCVGGSRISLYWLFWSITSLVGALCIQFKFVRGFEWQHTFVFLQANLFSLLTSMIALFVFVHRVGETKMKDVLGCLAVVVLHFILNTLLTEWRVIVAFLLLLAIGATTVWPGPSYIAARSLQALKMGGGRPYAMRLKDSKVSNVQIKGCLVLLTPSQVIVGDPKVVPLGDSSKPPACYLRAPARLGDSPVFPKINVITYERSNVLDSNFFSEATTSTTSNKAGK